MLAPLCILLAAIVVHAEKCTSVTDGDLSGREVRLPPVILAKHQKYWDLIISQTCVQYGGKRVTVCDDDAAPNVYITSGQTARVVRQGLLNTEAIAYVTMFCREGALHQGVAGTVQAKAAVTYEAL